jgi:thymidylate kinase
MFINIVGGDGAGKSTQIDLLKPWLERTYGLPVRLLAKSGVFDANAFPECRFFRDSYGRICREMMPAMHGEARSLFLLFLVATHVRHYPPGEREIVLADGYWQKTFATEAALGIDTRWLLATTSCLPRPDLCIFLDVDPCRTVERLASFNSYECGFRTERNVETFVANQRKVYQALSTLAERDRWERVTADRDIESVFDDVRSLVERHMMPSTA